MVTIGARSHHNYPTAKNLNIFNHSTSTGIIFITIKVGGNTNSFSYNAMDQSNREDNQAQGTGDESVNTSSTENSQQNNTEGQHRKGGIHNNALYAASMARPATAAVDPHNTSDLASTGTNISYEGPTAPGSGGSAGTGYTSGQAATGASVTTGSDYDQAAVSAGRDNEASDEKRADDAENEINEQR